MLWGSTIKEKTFGQRINVIFILLSINFANGYKKNKGHPRQQRISLWSFKVLSQIFSYSSLKNWEAAVSVITKVLFQWAVSRHGTASDSLTKNQERERVSIFFFLILHNCISFAKYQRVSILNVLFVKCTNKKTLQWEGRAIFLRWVATVSGSVIFLISINNYDWPPFPSNLSVPIDFYWLLFPT